MASNPAFPFYASDWLGSNRRAMMSLEQQAGYINLLCRQWADPTCSLPDDDNVLARLSELGEGWFKGGSEMVRKCFPKHPSLTGRIANEKLLKIKAERDEWSRKSSEGGRKSAKVRRAKARHVKGYDKTKGGLTTVGSKGATKGATKGQPKGNSPSPSPSPLPSPSSCPSPSPSKASTSSKRARCRADDIRLVYDHYRTYHPGKPAELTSKAKEHKPLCARLDEGYSVETLCKAIDGCHLTPHNLGLTGSGQKYLGLELIMRNGDQVTRFAETADNPPQTGMTEKERRGVVASQQFLKEVQE